MSQGSVILSEAKDLCSFSGLHRSFAPLRMTRQFSFSRSGFPHSPSRSPRSTAPSAVPKTQSSRQEFEQSPPAADRGENRSSAVSSLPMPSTGSPAAAADRTWSRTPERLHSVNETPQPKSLLRARSLQRAQP